MQSSDQDDATETNNHVTETIKRASDEGAQSLPTLAREPHRARRARGMPRQAVLRERARPGVRGRHSRTARWRRGGRRRAGGGRGRAGEIGRGAAVTSESWMQRQARARVTADAGTHAYARCGRRRASLLTRAVLEGDWGDGPCRGSTLEKEGRRDREGEKESRMKVICRYSKQPQKREKQ